MHVSWGFMLFQMFADLLIHGSAIWNFLLLWFHLNFFWLKFFSWIDDAFYRSFLFVHWLLHCCLGNRGRDSFDLCFRLGLDWIFYLIHFMINLFNRFVIFFLGCDWVFISRFFLCFWYGWDLFFINNLGIWVNVDIVCIDHFWLDWINPCFHWRIRHHRWTNDWFLLVVFCTYSRLNNLGLLRFRVKSCFNLNRIFLMIRDRLTAFHLGFLIHHLKFLIHLIHQILFFDTHIFILDGTQLF